MEPPQACAQGGSSDRTYDSVGQYVCITTMLASTTTTSAGTTVMVMQGSVQRVVTAGIHSLLGHEGQVTLYFQQSRS